MNFELIIACQRGDFKTVKFLVESKADIMEKNHAVRAASEYGHLEIVKFLLESEPKADITSMDNWAVRWASENGHLETVKFLVESKADITACDSCALRWAGERGQLEIVKFLVEQKVDINARDDWAVEAASKNGHLETVKFLLSKGADFKKLTPEHQIYFRTLKAWRRWRFKVFLRKLFQVALPLYYSPGFPGYFRGRNSLKKLITGISI